MMDSGCCLLVREHRRWQHACPQMDYLGSIAVILVCGLFADNILLRRKLADQERRIRALEDIRRSG